MYGTLNAALLFWTKLSNSLTKLGFMANPYDRCCMNKQINGQQCTILWHVDDIKVSHMDPDVVTTVLAMINEEYGKELPLTVTRGVMHDYLRMTIDFSHKGQVRFTMFDYIANMLKALPDVMKGESATPAGELGRLMKYLEGTIGLPLILGMDKSGKIRWYTDAAFAAHNNMKSHTGAVMTMGQGAANSQSSKQKLNTKSSTESEFVAVDDVISQVIWTRYFLEGQRERINDNIVYQDNQSAIKLEKNGMKSSKKQTRHISIRYFFVTDRISAKELNVEYCPTLDMLGDYFTKPLQGSLFRKF
jgi:hypothetical protein